MSSVLQFGVKMCLSAVKAVREITLCQFKQKMLPYSLQMLQCLSFLYSFFLKWIILFIFLTFNPLEVFCEEGRLHNNSLRMTHKGFVVFQPLVYKETVFQVT